MPNIDTFDSLSRADMLLGFFAFLSELPEEALRELWVGSVTPDQEEAA